MSHPTKFTVYRMEAAYKRNVFRYCKFVNQLLINKLYSAVDNRADNATGAV